MGILENGGALALLGGRRSVLEANGEVLVTTSNSKSAESSSITIVSGEGSIGSGNVTLSTGISANGQGGNVQITSGGSTTPALAGSVNIQSTKNADNAILLLANGGINETIVIHSNQGTGVNITGASQNASISLLSDAGGIGLYSAFYRYVSVAL